MLPKLTAIIVDDEDHARKIIRTLVSEDKEIEILSEYDNGIDAVKGIESEQPDLVFLDIQMPELNGFEVIRNILDGETEKKPDYIFITAYDEHAVKAFEVNAIDYILKPYEDDRFYEALERAKDRIFNHKQEDITKLLKTMGHDSYLRKLMIKDRHKVHLIDASEINWIEAADQYCQIHAQTGKHLVRKSLRFYEENLSPDQFFRSHRSSLVNLNAIKELQTFKKGNYVIILHSGETVELGPGKMEKLKLAVGRSF